MAKNQVLFIISGFVSLLFLFIVLSLCLFLIIRIDNKKIYALKKDVYISVSIKTPIVETKKVKQKKAEEKVVQKVVQEINEKTVPSKEVDIDNLFNNVWAKKVDIKKITKKKINNRRIADIQKKIKTKKIATASTKENSKSEILKETTDSKASSANEVNEYLAKIQAIVYKYFYPPENSQGNSVKAVIEINPLGKVIDFRILNYSQNDSLNKECDSIKNRLASVAFPLSPNSKTQSYIIILKSEE